LLNTTSSLNTAVGVGALYNNTGGSNTAIGEASGYNISSGSCNITIGRDAGRAGFSPFGITTEDNRVVIGTDDITNAYIQVAFTVTSDLRDKTNFGTVPHGLDFVSKLEPVSFQFKKSRQDDTPHGQMHYGFKAQDILALEGDNNVIIDNEQPDKLKYKGEHLVPVLVNAIKELSEENKDLKSRIEALESN
jgi:hypothetical protein